MIHDTRIELTLAPYQDHIVQQSLDNKVFLEGPAGTGKTTAGVQRLVHLLNQGVEGGGIIVLVPQRTLAGPYSAVLRSPTLVAGETTPILTLGGLAQRLVDLFWPLVAEKAGFAWPDALPTFLTLETAQYYMAHLVRPLLDEGLFDSVTLERNRLYSQVLDNLNKAAVVGFPHHEIGERLKSAWVGDPGQLRVYEDVHHCVRLFRQYCLEHNLLDFSLQVEVFQHYLWPEASCREYLRRTYRHLIFDNLEEDTPLAYDLLHEWLPDFDSALLIYDSQAGYRRFLGADPGIGYQLREQCPVQAVFDRSFVTSPAIGVLASHLGNILGSSHGVKEPRPEFNRYEQNTPGIGSEIAGPLSALEFSYHRFYPQMLDWVAEQIAQLVHEKGIDAGEIVVLAPFLSDALRFALVNRLQAYQVPARSHRPSRSLREEPVTQCLLTLSMLAHPEWGYRPSRFDVAYALMQSIEGLDLVRAQLLAEIVFRLREGAPRLSSFDQIKPEVQERLTYRLGERYERLRLWLEEYQTDKLEYDYFLSRLFGEVLSQPGYGFHQGFDAGEVTANLIESVQKFRWVAGETLATEGSSLGKEYVGMVQDGVIAAQYIRSWQVEPAGAVLLAPAYTFLMSNRPVDVQFWLDVGSRGWSERLNQPLTHPYVLSRDWSSDRLWSDLDEVEVGRETLYCLALGLLRRCRSKVYLGLSELGEQGFEQRGPLLQAFQRLLRQVNV